MPVPSPWEKQGESWVYAKVGTTEVRGRRDPAGIQIEQVSPTYDLSEFDKAVKIIEEKLKWKQEQPETSPIKRTKCPYCGQWAVNLERHLKEWHARQIPKLAEPTLAQQMVEMSEEPTDGALLLHFTEHEIEGSARIIDEAKLRASTCRVFTYKGREYGFAKGAIGLLTPEQIAQYCQGRKVYNVAPGLAQRFQKFAEAAQAARARIAHLPKGQRFGPYLEEMSRELTTRGIEV